MAANSLQTKAGSGVNTAKGFANPVWADLIDKLQSLSGVVLGLFLVMHLQFESSLLLGKEAFYQVAQFIEGGVFSETDHGYSLLTQIFFCFISLVVSIHAVPALCRFPTQIGQWRALRNQMRFLPHEETKIWFWQMITGFLLFFLVPIHFFTMMTTPETGPHLSAERVYHFNTWASYVLLLPIVTIHAVFGLYRVVVKWGLVAHRFAMLKFAKMLFGYLMLLGMASMLVYIILGRSLGLPEVPYVSTLLAK
jgi:fumarate reductase subunit C